MGYPKDQYLGKLRAKKVSLYIEKLGTDRYRVTLALSKPIIFFDVAFEMNFDQISTLPKIMFEEYEVTKYYEQP